MKSVKLDIVIGDRFYCTIVWKYNPLWPINFNELEDEIISRLPYLRGKQFQVCFPDEYGL